MTTTVHVLFFRHEYAPGAFAEPKLVGVFKDQAAVLDRIGRIVEVMHPAVHDGMFFATIIEADL